MNLLELYTENPSNYFICADTSRNQFAGGIGKTSQMQYLANEIFGKEVEGYTQNIGGIENDLVSYRSMTDTEKRNSDS